MKMYNIEFLDTVNEDSSSESVIVGIASESVIIGTASEIRPVYKAIVRAFQHGCRTTLVPIFCKFPTFVDGRYYGISIDDDGYFQIVNDDTLVSMFMDGVLSKESEVY